MTYDAVKTLSFLYVAQEELRESSEFAGILLNSGLLEQHTEEPSAEHRALDLALVVSYARLFGSNFGYGRVEENKKRALAVLNPDEANLHAAIMKLRDREYAHSDAEANDIEVHMDDMFLYSKRIVRWPLGIDQVRQLAIMSEKLMASFHSQSDELRQSLLGGKSE